MNRIADYIRYHVDSSRALDIDPQIEAIRYLCDRYELNEEQRLWLCFLFSTNYCVPTTYFMYNEFPDYQTVDVPRLQRWWEANREKLIFQTDRAWVRSRNQFVGVFESYRQHIRKWSGGSDLQAEALHNLLADGQTPTERYALLLDRFDVAQFGRFTMFSTRSCCTTSGVFPSGCNSTYGRRRAAAMGLCSRSGSRTRRTLGARERPCPKIP